MTNKKEWILFIDDERYPVNENAVIARSSQQAIDLVSQRGVPIHIDFDHDLGGDDTSRRFILWLCDWMLNNRIYFPINFTWGVHSQNPVGVDWINGTMNLLVNEFSEKQN